MSKRMRVWLSHIQDMDSKWSENQNDSVKQKVLKASQTDAKQMWLHMLVLICIHDIWDSVLFFLKEDGKFLPVWLLGGLKFWA